MKSISGEKAKNDRIDSKKIAGLLRANLLPKAYVCPRLFRSHRQVVVLSKRDPIMKILVEDLEKRHGKRKARSVFVHKISRAIYYMLVKKYLLIQLTFMVDHNMAECTKKLKYKFGGSTLRLHCPLGLRFNKSD